MWRTLEVKFGIIAACMPTIYPGFQVLCVWVKKHRSRSGHNEDSLQSDKAKLWHEKNKTAFDSNSTNPTVQAAATAPSTDMAIPETAILKTTEFGVQPATVFA